MPDSARADRTLPTVSVVLAVLDAEQTLGAQLDALAEQTYGGSWEVVVADNGCTDRSMALVDEARDRLPTLKRVPAAARRGDAHAKNRAVEEARGDIIVSCDADDVVQAGWLAALVAALAESDIAYGINDHESLNPPEVNSWYRFTRAGPLHVGRGGGNIGCWRHVWNDLGGFHEDLRYGADAEFRMRAEDAGYRIGITEDAMVLIGRRQTPGAMARQSFAGGLGLRQRAVLHPDWADREPGLALHHRLLRWALAVLAWPLAIVMPGFRGTWLRAAASLAGQVWARFVSPVRPWPRQGRPAPAADGVTGSSAQIAEPRSVQPSA